MSLRNKSKQPNTDPTLAGDTAVTASNLTEQFATEYAKSAVPNMLKAIESVKRYNRITLIGAMVTSYLHQAHYLASIGAGIFAYLPPAIFDTAMVAMLIVMRTHGIAKEAKRLATVVFCCLALLSATVNFASPGDIGLRVIFALVVALVIGVELVAGRIRPDFEAIEKHAAELVAAANRIKTSTAETPAEPTRPVPAKEIPAAPSPAEAEPAPDIPAVPAHLLTTARFSIVQHEQTIGRPITVDELAVRMSVTPAIAAQLLTEIRDTTTTASRINGHVPTLNGGSR
jgi:hypothetical protein